MDDDTKNIPEDDKDDILVPSEENHLPEGDLDDSIKDGVGRIFGAQISKAQSLAIDPILDKYSITLTEEQKLALVSSFKMSSDEAEPTYIYFDIDPDVAKKIKDDYEKKLASVSVLDEEFRSLNRVVSGEKIFELSEAIDEGDQERQTKIYDDIQIGYPDQEKIKKSYTYKVDGKISSGIKELDTVIELFIQPVLNKLLIAGSLPFFFVGDKIQDAFLGDKESEVKSHLAYWSDNMKKLEKGYSFLKGKEYLNENQNFSWSIGRKKRQEKEQIAANAFNEMLVDALFKADKNDTETNLLMDKLDNNAYDEDGKLLTLSELKTVFLRSGDNEAAQQKALEQIENAADLDANEKKTKGIVLDPTKDKDRGILAIQEVLKEALAETRVMDADGKPINKANDNGKKKFEAIIGLIDLFNKKGSSDFYNAFSGVITHYRDGYKASFNDGSFIEDEENDYKSKQKDLIAKQDEIYKRRMAMGGGGPMQAPLESSPAVVAAKAAKEKTA